MKEWLNREDAEKISKAEPLLILDDFHMILPACKNQSKDENGASEILKTRKSLDVEVEFITHNPVSKMFSSKGLTWLDLLMHFARFRKRKQDKD